VTRSPTRLRFQEQWLTGDESPLDPAQKATCAGIPHDISRRDTMYRGDLEHYWRVGLSAVECLEEALNRVPGLVVTDVLDLPCGYGRVLRFLGHRFPAATIHACDLDRRAVDYCVQTFGARGAYSRPDLDGFAVDDRYDLAWCGSLVTHLDAPRIAGLDKLRSRRIRARLSQYAAGGYAFTPYPAHDGYGISVTSPARFRRLWERDGDRSGRVAT